MAKAFQQYIREVHEATGYWPTWSPISPLELGTVGTIEDMAFVPKIQAPLFRPQLSAGRTESNTERAIRSFLKGWSDH